MKPRNYLLPFLLVSIATVAILLMWQRSEPGPGARSPAAASVEHAKSGDDSIQDSNDQTTKKPAPVASNFLGMRTIQEASDAGIYKLSTAELWQLTRDHPSEEIRQRACAIAGCSQYALKMKHPDKPVSMFFVSAHEAEYIAFYCREVAESNGPNEFIETYRPFIDSCNKRPQVSGDHQRLADLNLTANQIADSLASAATPEELYDYTLLAIQKEQGLTGIDFATLKSEHNNDLASLEQRLSPFLDFLATKFGCRMRGYCEPGSSVLLDICGRLGQTVVCMPGDNIESIAERNLTPLQFAMWRQAQVQKAGEPRQP